MMPDDMKPRTLAEMSVQTAENPNSPAETRARFFNSGNAFNIILDPVPDRIFASEIEDVTASGAPTGFTPCDSSEALGTDALATTPFLLARYARINDGDKLVADFNCQGSLWYVIRGTGRMTMADQEIAWAQGDVFTVPGGTAATLEGISGDAVLWVVTNEPQLDFENAKASELADNQVDITHFTAAEIERQIDLMYGVDVDAETAGLALVFSSEQQLERRNITPTMTLAMNTLPPGNSQPGHRHNSVAVMLLIQTEGCHSIVDGVRKDWAPYITTVTPPTAYHSHHNAGSKQARFLIVQDGGLYYHARTMGFSFD